MGFSRERGSLVTCHGLMLTGHLPFSNMDNFATCLLLSARMGGRGADLEFLGACRQFQHADRCGQRAPVLRATGRQGSTGEDEREGLRFILILDQFGPRPGFRAGAVTLGEGFWVWGLTSGVLSRADFSSPSSILPPPWISRRSCVEGLGMRD